MSPSLSAFFFFCLASPRCDKTVDRWVCRCVHWSTMTGGLWACCLETVSWQAWQGGPAAPQADKGQARPGAQVAWLRRGRRLQCIVKLFLNKKKIPAALRIYHVCIYLSAGTQQTLSQQTRFFARRKDRQRADAGFQWKKVLSEAKNSPSESLEYICPNPHPQQECKTIKDHLNKSNLCHISMHLLFYIAFLIFASVQMIWHCNNVFPARLLLILLPFPQN